MRSQDEMSCDRRTARIRLAAVLTLALFGVAFAKLVRIQLIEHAHYAGLADAQHTHRETLEPRRGRILDRNGFLLAGNTPVVTFEVYWPNVPVGSEASIDTLCMRLRNSGRDAVILDRTGVNQILARNVPYEEALPFIEAGLPSGVNLRMVELRTYPLGDQTAMILGRAGQGCLEGLEKEFDQLLSGTAGVRYVERSAYPGMSVTDSRADNLMPVDGSDLMLTIDARFQCIVQEELREAVEHSGGSWGAALVVDPSNGDILAMGSWPVRAPDGSIAANHCISSIHEPGSTFKLVTLAACLEEGLAVSSDSFDCSTGKIPVADRTISDCHVYGVLSVEEIIAHSSNVGTIRLAQLMSDSLLYAYCRAFGFGSRTGLELPGEEGGILRPPSQWSGMSHACIAIGQEVGVTPLQLAMAFSAVANGGVLYQPRLIRASREDGAWRNWASFRSRRVISEETAGEMRRILASTVEYGTGMSAAVDGVTVAGKTGTAERLLFGSGVYLSAFAGMIPAEQPGLVAVVVVDRPGFAYRYGSTLAAPAFSRMMSGILSCEPGLAMSGTPRMASGMLAQADSGTGSL